MHACMHMHKLGGEEPKLQRQNMDDAVTFLEAAREVYADVTSLLNKTQLLALDMDFKDAFCDINVCLLP